jgi:hypothetical protein
VGRSNVNSPSVIPAIKKSLVKQRVLGVFEKKISMTMLMMLAFLIDQVQQ